LLASYIRVLIITLTICVLLASYTQSDNMEDPNNKEIKDVAIILTNLDVNDTTLGLSYKIKNNTDHDVWICDIVSMYSKMEKSPGKIPPQKLKTRL